MLLIIYGYVHGMLYHYPLTDFQVPVVGLIVASLFLTLLLWWCHRKRYGKREGYMEIGGQSLQDHLRFTQFVTESAQREVAALNCRYYLRSRPEYELIRQMGDIGSRVGKSWFSVRARGRREQVSSFSCPRAYQHPTHIHHHFPTSLAHDHD